MNPGRQRVRAVAGGCITLLVSGMLVVRAQQEDTETPGEAPHADCALFGPKREQLLRTGLTGEKRLDTKLSDLTLEVASRLPRTSASSKAGPRQAAPTGTIDRHIFAALEEAGVSPAGRASDLEFLRRVSLDMTGRIPTPERVASFAIDSDPGKRTKLVEELINKPEWVDRWTLYFGDLFQNTAVSNTTSVIRFADGRNAFYNWIKKALTENRPYNRIATDIIAAQGTNSYENEQGQINWLVNGFVTNGPAQDAYDQMAANVADTFLGINHMNCVLCHNGRGHLDSLSLWGKSTSRSQAWGMAAYMAKTVMTRRPVTQAARNPYYWSVTEPGARTDYMLNTTTGNRPARCANAQAPGEDGRCPATGTVSPEYPFNGKKPAGNESYRGALAREITNDVQFARATVNYIWKEFFGRGIVDPVNQFDPARLDPDNPPPAPWTLQPSNARLLNALAHDFIASGYDLKALMRQIANSEAYQLSARYDGEWSPAWEKLFARKLVRRLTAEEIHDALADSSNVLPNYNIAGLGRVTFASQFPELRGMPDGVRGRVAGFLDGFLRGNRDDEERRGDSSVVQALNLMNDPYVMTRIRATGTGANASLLQRALPLGDEQLVETLFVTVLSRYPTGTEKTTALESLRSGTRRDKAENLLWSLYNKVDFIFNY